MEIFLPGYFELIYPENKKSICSFLKTYISDLNKNVEYVSISSSEDSLVSFKSAYLPKKDNVYNIHFSVEDNSNKNNYAHSEIIDKLNINGFKNILEIIIEDKGFRDPNYRMIHINKDCTYVNKELEQSPDYVLEICNHCLEELYI